MASIDEPRSGDALPDDAVAAFAAGFGGAVIGPDDPDYDGARAVWNGMIDRYPALIARPRGVADVIAAVNFARDRGLPLAVRGGGHNVAGSAVRDGALVIDLSGMRGVRVDPDARTVRAEGGATWGDVDRETQVFGLAAPGGVVSDTGIAGLTLGGGFGWLSRKYGMSIDNLLSADVVTADGELVVASEDSHPDLFWAVRGGGGNFGVVTSFEYRLHEVGPEVAMCFAWYPADRAADVLRSYREEMDEAPDEVSAIAFYAWVPELEEFPESSWGDPAMVVAAVHAGDPETGERELRPLRELAEPIADLSGALPFVDLQRLLDEDYPHGRRYYWKSTTLSELSDAAIDRIVAHSEKAPSKLSTVDVWYGGGAITAVDPDATAYRHRDAPYLLNPEANWDDPADDEANVAWVRGFVADMREFSGGGLYTNFAGFGESEEGDLARRAYGGNYDRLRAVKERYDPGDLFGGNLRVAPAA